MPRLAIALIVVAAVLSPPHVRAQLVPAPGADRYFRVEWSVAHSVTRGAVISGYVHNSYGLPADNVRLLIEAVDGSGEVVATSIGYVLGSIPAGDRRYFQETVPRTVPTYRVRVVLYEWIDRGGA